MITDAHVAREIWNSNPEATGRILLGIELARIRPDIADRLIAGINELLSDDQAATRTMLMDNYLQSIIEFFKLAEDEDATPVRGL